jgi:bifunctional polynucleotide phosphatase/kinase
VYDCIPEKLNELRQNGWKIVLFTNQKKKSEADVPFGDIVHKVDKLLGEDVDIFISHRNDYLRKPVMGMWDKFLELNGKIHEAYYVGDAAGRKDDFSISDRLFAHNIGIPFFTPDEFFLKEKDDKIYTGDGLKNKQYCNLEFNIDDLPNGKTLVIMVGPPASGKSTLAGQINNVRQAVICSNDLFKGVGKKTIKLCEKYMKEDNDLIIVDNTNPSVESRKPYMDLAMEYSYKTVYLHMDIPINHAKHLNIYRGYKNKSKMIPELVYRIYNKKFSGPQETFDTVLEYSPTYTSDAMKYMFF